jgi:hypothetical protein
MSLSRLALRLAAVETLAPYAQIVAADPAWPTYAAGRVFDTQITAVAQTEAEARTPLIVVYTDEDKTKAQGTAQDVTLPGDGETHVTLAFEIQVPVALSDDAIAPYGPSDSLAEAILDMIEDQILQRLADARTGALLASILVTIEGVESQPWRDADNDIRLSARRLELTCRVRERERWPVAGATGLDRLPQPLRDVAKALPAESYGGRHVALLADLLGSPKAFPALNDLRLALNLTRAAGDTPPPAADASAEPPVGDVAGQILL